MSQDFQLPPYSHDVRHYSDFIILRALVAVLTPEQRKSFDANLHFTLKFLEEDSNIDPEILSQIKGAVMFKS